MPTGDSLLYQMGQQFTTLDQDNDLWSTGNCAVTHKGAWWYNFCFDSNLNGKYYDINTVSRDSVTWLTWTDGKYNSMKATEMKIKPFA